MIGCLVVGGYGSDGEKEREGIHEWKGWNHGVVRRASLRRLTRRCLYAHYRILLARRDAFTEGMTDNEV